MGLLADRVALVTGAGRKNGIGAAIARQLAGDGAHVVLTDICAAPSDLPHGGNAAWEELTAVADEIAALGVESLPLRVDVTVAEEVQGMVAETKERFGRLDIWSTMRGRSLDRPPCVIWRKRRGAGCWRSTPQACFSAAITRCR